MAQADSVRMQLSEIEVRQGSKRQTPIGGFNATFRQGLRNSGALVSQVAQSAGYAIPAAAVLGAAVQGAGTEQDVGGGYAAGPSTGLLSGGSAGGVGAASMEGVMQRAANGDHSAQLLAATQQMQELNQQFNIQMIQLQERCQQDSRQYTAISNVMKVRHDTARNALSNLK